MCSPWKMSTGPLKVLWGIFLSLLIHLTNSFLDVQYVPGTSINTKQEDEVRGQHWMYWDSYYEEAVV